MFATLTGERGTFQVRSYAPNPTPFSVACDGEGPGRQARDEGGDEGRRDEGISLVSRRRALGKPTLYLRNCGVDLSAERVDFSSDLPTPLSIPEDIEGGEQGP